MVAKADVGVEDLPNRRFNAISKERLDEFELALADGASEEKRKGILSYVTSINSDQAKQIAP